MTPAEENALIVKVLADSGYQPDHDLDAAGILTIARLAIRAAYDKGRAEGTANERKRATHICDRWSGVGDVVARAIAAAIRRGV